ncbi:MAG: hypothetical protein L0212_09400 [Acidobacteria bacterium]|nr:hypothetical protein [Acidobacteriota bacterium]
MLTGTKTRIALAALMLATLAPASLLPQGEATSSAAPISRDQALQVFGHFKALTGRWRGESTKGWEGDSNYRVLARDSVVMSTSEFDDAPGRGMVTMFHMDGDRLLLTHYCEARNQPRLVATTVEDDGRTVVFTFLDGTNLSSRDAGHMDKAVYHFDGPDQFRSRWTWYQKGQETWFEDVRYTRVREQPER